MCPEDRIDETEHAWTTYHLRLLVCVWGLLLLWRMMSNVALSSRRVALDNLESQKGHVLKIGKIKPVRAIVQLPTATRQLQVHDVCLQYAITRLC